MRLGIFLAISLAIAVTAVGQTSGDQAGDQEREALCKKVACREATTVKLKVNEKEYAEFEFPKGPFVAYGFINILSGEKFFVEFDEQDGKLINARFVKQNIHPDHTLSVGFSQNEEGMVLAISNPFSRTIVYDCMTQHNQHLTKTSVVPVAPKSASYESWPYPISQIVIYNVDFRPETGGIGPGKVAPGPKARILSRPPPEVSEAESPQLAITIVLRATFTKDAQVADVRFVKATPADAPKEMVTFLTGRAIDAAKGIKFVPAVKDGRPVSMYMQLEYNFGPQKKEATPAPPSPATKNSAPEEKVPGV